MHGSPGGRRRSETERVLKLGCDPLLLAPELEPAALVLDALLARDDEQVAAGLKGPSAAARARVAMQLTGDKTRPVFDRYNIVSESDLRAGVDRLAAYVKKLPKETTVEPLKRAGKGRR